MKPAIVCSQYSFENVKFYIETAVKVECNVPSDVAVNVLTSTVPFERISYLNLANSSSNFLSL